MNIRRFLTTSVATVLVLAGTAVPARAETVTPRTSTVLYRCTYPATGLQNSTFAASFSTDDVVAVGSTITLRNVTLTQVIPLGLRALLASAGFDRIRGSLTTSITSASVYPDAPISGGLYEQTIPSAGSMTFTVQAWDVTTTADVVGPARFALSTQITEDLEFRSKATGNWTRWISRCGATVTTPSGPTFQPDIEIT